MGTFIGFSVGSCPVFSDPKPRCSMAEVQHPTSAGYGRDATSGWLRHSGGGKAGENVPVVVGPDAIEA